MCKQNTKSKTSINGDNLSILPNSNLIEKYHSNTCGFDAFVQCFANCVDSKNLHSNLKSDEFSLLIKCLLNGDVNLAIEKRYSLLLEIFEGEANCLSSVLKTPNEILKLFPSLKILLYCNDCGNEFEDSFKYIPIREIDLEQKGIETLQTCLDEPMIKKCGRCLSESITPTYEYSNIIVMYVEPFGKNQFKTSKLCKIPKTLEIMREKYSLNSLVHYIKNSIDPDLSHFVSICLRNKNWQCYDDLNSIVTKRNENSDYVLPHLLFYTKCT